MKTVITSEYEALFRQHFRLATLYAERIVGSAHEAEDIVQEVFIALLDVDFSQIRQKESYLYRCVRNAALDHLHWKQVIGTLAGDDTFICIVTSEPDAADLVLELKKLLSGVDR